MNQNILTQVVSSEGYAERDMRMYYSGCYLLNEQDEPVQFVTTDDNRPVVQGMDGDTYTTEYSLLRKFVVPCGLYISERNKVFRYSYLQSRSYKKALDPQYVKVMGVGLTGRQSIIRDILRDKRRVTTDEGVIEKVSDRMIIKHGKIITSFNMLSVGSVDGSEVDSPFPAVHQRLEQYHAQQHI